MNAGQATLLNTALNVQAFLDQYATVIGGNVASARRNFDEAVTSLSTLAAKQQGSTFASRGATNRLKAVRARLRNHHMSPVRHAARMALADVPEFKALTVTTRNLPDQRLVAAALGMADAATQYTRVFTQNGLPDDFVAQLRSAAGDVVQLAIERDRMAADMSGATASMLAQESRVRKLLKLLNALVVPRLGTDATMLTKWRKARAIEHQREIVAVPASVLSVQSDTVAEARNPADSVTPPAH